MNFNYPTVWVRHQNIAAYLGDRLRDAWVEVIRLNETPCLASHTNSELARRAAYNTADRRWAVTVARAGIAVHLCPTPMVLTTGTLGRPRAPAFVEQRAVVIGAGNSTVDVCEDLAHARAASVTMMQHSPTRDFSRAPLRAVWPVEVPLEVMDVLLVSAGFGLLKMIVIADPIAAWEANRQVYDSEKLRKGGAGYELGPERQVVYPQVFDRFGGSWRVRGIASFRA
ncbi:hypothetical protein V8D89_000767 [Ganoderma adspersum]